EEQEPQTVEVDRRSVVGRNPRNSGLEGQSVTVSDRQRNGYNYNVQQLRKWTDRGTCKQTVHHSRNFLGHGSA
ncbi:hypothetical protein LINGRAHAP2_LOCUS4850, partial [Linum grandiflorum]